MKLSYAVIEQKGQEPSAGALRSLMQQAHQRKARVLVADRYHASKSSEAIARELGLSIVALSPLETDLFQEIQTLVEALTQS
jgi:ABC-type Zn uptake system ZnuABC Zn-binding protein ZnuA